jgi:hypothetical protein
MAGSGIFTHFSITVEKWLDDVKVDQLVIGG